MISMKVVAKCFWVYGIAIANGCFYHDIFAATIVAALCEPSAFLLIRDGGTTSNKWYCNKFALSSIVNNQYETSRLGSLQCIYDWRFGTGETSD
jgi:hypothetical protein